MSAFRMQLLNLFSKIIYFNDDAEEDNDNDGCDNVVIVVAAGADAKIYLVSLG